MIPPAGMTRIDFHSNIPDKIDYVCRLVRKALAASSDSRVVVLARDKAQLARLDEAMWTFSDAEFIPHAPADDPLARQSPVVLTDSDTADLPHHQILINLSSSVPAHFAQFDRMFEIVAADAADTEAGRQRFAYYRERGYTLEHHKAGSRE